MTTDNLTLPPEDKLELNNWLRSTRLSQGLAVRAKILLYLAEGRSPTDISQSLRVSRKMVYKWKDRYIQEGLEGLPDKSRSGRPLVISRETVDKVLKLTTERIPHESTHWSLRLMAKYAGVSKWQVQQIWKAADLKPHRIKTFKISNDPDFFRKSG